MLPVYLDSPSELSRTAQIVTGVRDLILQGVLRPGETVPSTRELARQLGVARGTVVTAYDQLTAESYLIARPGAPTRVHPQAAAFGVRGAQRPAARQSLGGAPSVRNVDVPFANHGISDKKASTRSAPSAGVEAPRALGGSLVPGQASASVSGADFGLPPGRQRVQVDLRPQHRRQFTLDDPMWRAAWRRAATQPADSSQLGARLPDSYAGLGELRAAISEHLRLTRSMMVNPDQIMVTAGAREGLDLVLTALRRGVQDLPALSLEPMAVEFPGYRGLQKLLTRRDVELVQSPADRLGIQPEFISDDTKSILVTPNHLYPWGGSMPAPRRLELLQRAHSLGAVVIEDDYDSEFRHLDAPIPSLWELAPQQVIHLGTFHQVLTPEAHIGYLIAPAHLERQLQSARADVGGGASPITQRAVADYLQSGGLRRHLARRRRQLLGRRRVVQDALGGLGVETISGSSAVLSFASQERAQAFSDACANVGIAATLVTDYWQAPQGTQSVAGCLISYADVSEEQLRSALDFMVDWIASAAPA